MPSVKYDRPVYYAINHPLLHHLHLSVVFSVSNLCICNWSSSWSRSQRQPDEVLKPGWRGKETNEVLLNRRGLNKTNPGTSCTTGANFVQLPRCQETSNIYYSWRQFNHFLCILNQFGSQEMGCRSGEWLAPKSPRFLLKGPVASKPRSNAVLGEEAIMKHIATRKMHLNESKCQKHNFYYLLVTSETPLGGSKCHVSESPTGPRGKALWDAAFPPA